MDERLAWHEILGVAPWRERLRETQLALAGDAFTPKTRFDHTSLRIFQPRLAWQLWRGRAPGRLAPIYNLFNHAATPEAAGWSVRKTHVRDFRGSDLTYDSHNGTDFAVVPGSVIVAPAAGTVVLVVSEFNRGGLKLMLDHGDGLATSYAHLARALVTPGQVVTRGQPIALSGASGLNFVGSLGLDAPHLHFNVWLGGTPVDPFARPGEVSLWASFNDPVPGLGGGASGLAPRAEFQADVVDAWIASCLDPAMRARLSGLSDLRTRGLHTIFFANYYPTRFGPRPQPYRTSPLRTPRLDLPLTAQAFDGITFGPHVPSR